MKQLALVRHSIAQEPEEAENDFSRKLTSNGITLAQRVVSQVPIEYLNQPIFISSPACRAKETAEIFANYIKLSNEHFIFHEFLYSCFKEQSLFYLLEELIPNFNNCWIFGHNPAISNLFNLLSKQNFSLPKCAVAIFHSNAKQWIDIQPHNTKLIHYINPKLLII
ncbi:MAG: hypothetical protein N2449_08430 [Bacteroidales bacterium]|nr:hypothetical protein [Bacteroidales bacterium]